MNNLSPLKFTCTDAAPFHGHAYVFLNPGPTARLRSTGSGADDRRHQTAVKSRSIFIVACANSSVYAACVDCACTAAYEIQSAPRAPRSQPQNVRHFSSHPVQSRIVVAVSPPARRLPRGRRRHRLFSQQINCFSATAVAVDFASFQFRKLIDSRSFVHVASACLQSLVQRTEPIGIEYSRLPRRSCSGVGSLDYPMLKPDVRMGIISLRSD